MPTLPHLCHAQEACDAASADMAREKWLELELERQRQLADASTEQLACAENDKQQLRHKIQQLEVSRCHCSSRQLCAVSRQL